MATNIATEPLYGLNTALQLLQKNNQVGSFNSLQKPNPTSALSNATNDVVSLSTQAIANLAKAIRALAANNTSNVASSGEPATWRYQDEMTNAVYGLIQSPQQSVSFDNATMTVSDTSGGNPVTVPTAAILALVNGQGGSYSSGLRSVAGLTTPSALGNFATIYADHAADGVDGRFYKSTDPADLTGMMSSDEAASFTQAFNSHTLTIQTFSDAGVKYTGTQGSFVGQGMTTGGGATDATAAMAKSQYVLTSIDPVFGGYVVSWGGSPA